MTRIGRLLALFALLVAAAPAAAQPSLEDANRAIDGAMQALSDGDRFRSNGDVFNAQGAYEAASMRASQAINIGNANNVPFGQHPTAPFFLFGHAELSRAQLLYEVGAPWTEIAASLDRAARGFSDALALIDRRYPPGSPPWVAQRREALFARGTVAFMQGDYRTSDAIMMELQGLDPGFAPAGVVRETIRQIPPDSGGQSARPPSNDRLKQYAIEFGKAALGRWGTIAGMLIEDLFPTGN